VSLTSRLRTVSLAFLAEQKFRGHGVSLHVRSSTPAVPALSDVSSSSGSACGPVCTLSSGGESSQSATDDSEGENLLAEAYGNGHGLIVGED
jgi:hypothetical protein